VGLIIGGCAVSPYQGKFVRDGKVDSLIGSATVLPEYTYYYTGPEAEPDAIVAIDNKYTFTGKYWIKVADADVKEKLQWWNWLIDNNNRIKYSYSGYRIMTPEGKQAGIWYSKYDYSVARFPGGSTMILYTPIDSEQRLKPFLPVFDQTE